MELWHIGPEEFSLHFYTQDLTTSKIPHIGRRSGETETSASYTGTDLAYLYPWHFTALGNMALHIGRESGNH
jgi:hypothetical protein